MPILEVWLRCPSCGHRWHAASIDDTKYYAEHTSPEIVARQCYCVKCQQKPPMIVVHTEAQLELF